MRRMTGDNRLAKLFSDGNTVTLWVEDHIITQVFHDLKAPAAFRQLGPITDRYFLWLVEHLENVETLPIILYGDAQHIFVADADIHIYLVLLDGTAMANGILQQFTENDMHIKGLIGVQPNRILNARQNDTHLFTGLMRIVKNKPIVYRLFLLILNYAHK